MRQQDSKFAWHNVSISGVPTEVVAVFEQGAQINESNCSICISSRFRLDGTLGMSWLALGHDTLCVVESTMDTNGENPPILTFQIPILEVKSLETQSIVGGGRLIVTVAGVEDELIRFDTASAPNFQALTQHFSKSERDFSDFLEKSRKLSCQNCGRPLDTNTSVCAFCVKRRWVLYRIMTFAKPYAGTVALLGVLMLAGTALSLIPPQLLRIFVDEVIPNANASKLLGLVAALGAVLFGELLINVFRGRLSVWVGSHITNSIRSKTFSHLQTLSMAYFSKQQTGELMSRVNNDTRQMQGFLVDGIQYTVINLLAVVGIVIILITMNPMLGFLVLVPAPFVVGLSTFAWRKILVRFVILWKSSAALSGYLNDALSGIRVIKAFGQETAEVERFDIRNDAYREKLIDAEQTWQTLVPPLNFLVQTSLVLVWYFGAHQVWGSESFSLGQLMAFIGYLHMVFGPLQLLSRLNDWMTRALTAAARVFEILDTENEIQETTEPQKVEKPQGKIEISDVTFGYDKHDPVLKGLSLQVEPGSMVGLVGHSGVGKSTLINLVGRLYDVDEGSISIDGINVRNISFADLRKQIGYVLQETFLFNGTIWENIAYAKPQASKIEIMQAAVTANAHEFVMWLPDGYDTVVGERGQNLAGGERQRLAIARAVLQDPKILILDEATSSVDTETEAKIQLALSSLISNRTTIAIAHRLSTLRHASKIAVISDGQVVEVGAHQELLNKKDGIYKRLVDIQLACSNTMAVGG